MSYDSRVEDTKDRSNESSKSSPFNHSELWSGVAALSGGSRQDERNVDQLDLSSNPYVHGSQGWNSEGNNHEPNSGNPVGWHHGSPGGEGPNGPNGHGDHLGRNDNDLLVNKLLSDPSLTTALEGAAGQMSPQGMSALEHSLTHSLDLNPYTSDSELGKQALAQMTREGAPASDLAALQNMLSTISGSPTTTSDNNPNPPAPGSDQSPPVLASTPPTVTGGDTGSGTTPPVESTTPISTPPVESTTPTSTPPTDSTAPTTGSFTTSNGQIIGPNGQPFVAKGVDIGVSAANQDFNQVTSELTGLNMIRLNAVPGQDSVADIQNVINEYSAKGIVVEVEDHNDSGGLSTGSLSGDEQWYSQIAAANKNNPYVWFGTPNEPQGSDTSANEVGIYNAIRSAGGSSPILLEEGGGYQQNIVQQDLSADPSMKNVVDDFHFYDTNANASDGTNYINSQVAGAKAMGIPILVGEFGNAEDGEHVDQAGNAMTQDMITANQQSGVGALVWNWSNGSPGSEADNLIANSAGTSFTNFGQTIANWINEPS